VIEQRLAREGLVPPPAGWRADADAWSGIYFEIYFEAYFGTLFATCNNPPPSIFSSRKRERPRHAGVEFDKSPLHTVVVNRRQDLLRSYDPRMKFQLQGVNFS
jgi:hypothetical protein